MLKFPFIACVIIGLSVAAPGTLPKTRFVPKARAVSTGSDGLITISHAEPFQVPDANLKHVCLSGGGVSLLLTSAATKGSAYLSVGQNFATAPEECKSNITIQFPVLAIEVPQLQVAGEACGRTGTPSTAYSWSVHVEQVHPEGDIESTFSNEIVINCAPSSPNPVNEVGIVPVPAVEEVAGNATSNFSVQFNLVKSVGSLGGKWTFTLTPASDTIFVGEENFRIVNCIASTPKTDPEDVVPYSTVLIENGCVRDRGTSVNSDNSPTNQIISVSAFRFTGSPAGEIAVRCIVNLCNGGEGAPASPECPKVANLGEVCPADALGARTRRSLAFEHMYVVSA